MNLEQAHSTLQSVFGYPEFRGQQEAIIDHVLQGQDALVLMPTGGGKSLCYQIPAMLRPGLGVVISPLIALMQDQVEALLQLGVRAALINSSLSSEEMWVVEQQVLQGELDLLYVAPERLLTARFLELLQKTPLALFAIDEAHCVSQWGHDFRPEYTQLRLLHERFPQTPRIALTATADTNTRNDIIHQLQLEQAGCFVSSFDRPNIRYRVALKQNGRKQLLHFLNTEHSKDAGIVYCLSRKKVEQTAEWLCAQGREALPYHAGLSNEIRQKHQQRFLREEGIVMVATIAFGMGIDKSNVRFVAHLDLPKSVEAYYQETGRAGRDGLASNAWMVYSLGDLISLRKMMAQSEAPPERQRIEQQKLNAMLGYCETTSCRRKTLLHYFGEEMEQGACRNCDTCLEPVQKWDGSVEAQKALSCVFRTKQRFGAAHLIDVLMGKATARVIQFGHQHLSTFSIGSDLSKEQWHSIYRQLVASNFLAVDFDGYGGLYLTEKSRPILQGKEQVWFRKDPTLTLVKAPRTSNKTSSPAKKVSFDMPQSQELWEALRQKRLQLAQEQGVPPYIIFSDRTLIEMMQYHPKTLAEMSMVSGVGQKKLEHYGDIFLQILDQHPSPTQALAQ